MDKGMQVKIGALISYVSTFVTIFINLIYTPLLTRVLGQNEYGIYTVVAGVVNYLSLFSLGFGSAYLRYFTKYNTKGQKEEICKLNGIFFIVFMVLGLCALLTGMYLVVNIDIVLGNKLSITDMKIAQVLMLILVINIFMTFPSSVFKTIIMANEQYIFQGTVNLVSKIINPLLVLPLLLSGYKSIAVVLVTTFITCGCLVVNIYYCLCKLEVKFLFKGLDFHIIRDIGSFSFFIFLNMIIDQINWNVDKFILIRYSGAAAVAVYGVASQINSLYLEFSSKISTLYAPKVNRIVVEDKENSRDNLTQLFISVGRIQFMILMLVLMGFYFFGEKFIQLWVGTGYEDAYYVVLLLIIPVTVPLIQNLGIEIQRAKNMHQFRSVLYLLIAVCNVVISIPLAKEYGAIGSAIGTAISLSVGNILIMNVFYHRKIGLNIFAFWRSIISIMPSLVPCFIYGVLFRSLDKNISYSVYFLNVCIFIMTYLVLVYKFGMNIHEKKMLENILIKCHLRKRQKD